MQNESGLTIGWAQADITPPDRVAICGQFHIRLSEGVDDPLTATAFAMDDGDDHAVFVSCDLVVASNDLRDEVLSRLAGRAEGLDPRKVILHATHTHAGPDNRLQNSCYHPETMALLGLDAMSAADYVRFAGERIADAVAKAWGSRAPGKIAFGMDYAVVGRNRRIVNVEGVSKMLGKTDDAKFSHVEGYEDHSVNVTAVRDPDNQLTGLVVNIACPSQVSVDSYTISADFWCETRQELRARFGEKLFVLPQCSTAGDQCPNVLYDGKAHWRMLELAGRSERKEYALRIADAVQRVLETLGNHTDAAAPLRHHVEILDLPKNRITPEQVQSSLEVAENWRKIYEEEMQKLRDDPSLKERPRWYVRISAARSWMLWYQDVAARYEQQEKAAPGTYPCEMHVVRLGDIVFATSPFEYYLDFGVFIKARSKAVQTFLVELAGGGGYVPSLRSTAGGGYGSNAASNPVGPEGGRLLAERTVECINELWR